MQTSNRLIYCKGGTPIRNKQAGGLMGMLGGGGGGGPMGMLSGMAGGIGDMFGSMITGGSDPMAGAKEAGLDPAETMEIEGTGSKAEGGAQIANVATGVLSKIPGIGGIAASVAGPIIEGLFQRKANNQKEDKVRMLANANTDRTNDAAQGTALAELSSQKGGLLYRRPTNGIVSFVQGGPLFEKGGKAPELKWTHSFNLEFAEGTIEKKTRPVKIFKRGGKFDDPDKTNVIVAGSRHHERNELGDKGVPVIDNTGKKIFEVEKGELVLTKKVTDVLEKFLEDYKLLEEDEDRSHKVLSKLGSYFKKEIKDNLHNYEENVV